MARSLLRTLLLSLLLLTPLASSVSRAAPACSVRETVVAASLPKFKLDPIGLCGDFVPKALLSQLACRSGRCRDPEQRNFSTVALAASAYRHFGARYARNVESVLDAAALDGHEPLERCDPLGRFVPASARSLAPDFLSNLGYNQKRAKLETALRLCSAYPTAPCAMGSTDPAVLAERLPKAKDWKQLADLPELMAADTPPAGCRPVAVPRFTVHQEPGFSPMALRRELRRGRPVALSACLREGQKCSNHATLITGMRTRCCAGLCSRQYRLYDPQGAAWVAHDGKNWVDEAALANFNPHDLLWLEPAAKR